MLETILIFILTLVASAIGTATGFGTSTVMVPVMVLFLPMPVVLLFVGIIHLCGDLWKMLLFRKGFEWKLVLAFVIPGVVASFIGASLAVQEQALPLKRILGLFLVLYVLYLWRKPEWSLPKKTPTAAAGGTLSGLFAGFFGVGGAVRGAFLAAFDLPKEVYIFTSGLIALFIDVTRISRYLLGGARLDSYLLIALLVSIPVSFAGAWLAKKFLDRLPQKYFRGFVAVFLGLIAVKLLIWG